MIQCHTLSQFSVEAFYYFSEGYFLLQCIFFQIHLRIEVKDEDVCKINNSKRMTMYLNILPHAYPITYMNGIFHVSLPILCLP